jgi:hypothetical protein
MSPLGDPFIESILKSAASRLLYCRPLDASRTYGAYSYLEVVNNIAGDFPSSLAAAGCLGFRLSNASIPGTWHNYEMPITAEATKAWQDTGRPTDALPSLSQYADCFCYRFVDAFQFQEAVLRIIRDYAESSKSASKGQVHRTMGLVLQLNEIARRFSDYGSYALRSRICADSAYMGFRKRKLITLIYEANMYPFPGEHGNAEDPVRAEGVLKDAFRYFYDDKELLLVNADDADELMTHESVWSPRDQWGLGSRGYVVKLRPPISNALPDYRENTYVLTAREPACDPFRDHDADVCWPGDCHYRQIGYDRLDQPREAIRCLDGRPITVTVRASGKCLFEGSAEIHVITGQSGKLAAVSVTIPQYRIVLSPKQITKLVPSGVPHSHRYHYDGVLEPVVSEAAHELR